MTAVSVVVPAFDAAGTISDTLGALARQRLDAEYEVIVVDDGSQDATAELAAAAPGPVTVLRQEGSGAAEARNRGVAAARSPVLAFTDVDCVPAPNWLAEGLAALEGADLVQGAVAPPPGAALGPFDRSLRVRCETGLFESANLLVRRDVFERIGGFKAWLDHGGGRPFAEDTWFGWRARRAGARTVFSATAVVYHAVFPRAPDEYLAERLRDQYWPAVVRHIPEFREELLFARWFLNRRTAAFDSALAGTMAALATRSRLPLYAALPYAAMLGAGALPWRGRAPLVAAVQGAADAVRLVSLLRGSAAFRTLVL
jgi:glycosyltransferase involved in cell wall biosynthesis